MRDAEKVLLMDALANNPHIGITIINKDGIVVCRNQVNEDITGLKNTNLIGKHFSQVFHCKELLNVMETGIPKFGQSLKTVDGSQAVIHRIPLMVDNEMIGAASITTFKDARDMETLLAKYDFVKSKLKHYGGELRKLRAAKYSLENIIGKSDKIITNKKLAETYAQGNSPVLITGETGTGKELFAHAIHLASPRRNGPFIRVNCGAIPAELLESELFGYEEGAFTGAKRGTKVGKVELANHGTIFLDEISLLTMPMQPKLLTVLQNHEIERVGGNRIMKIDFRVISATNQDLRQMVEGGTFRNDLYYRLGVLNLDISPLRKRKSDIKILIQYFIEFL
jgi:transcriptional regulator with PAS, ATPase and Fis domain